MPRGLQPGRTSGLDGMVPGTSGNSPFLPLGGLVLWLPRSFRWGNSISNSPLTTFDASRHPSSRARRKAPAFLNTVTSDE